MKENVDKHIEKFVDNVMKSSTLEKPAFDFSSKVMAQVTTASQSSITVYKPLISKTVWVIIAAIILSITVYLAMTIPMDNSWFGTIDFSIVSNNKITELFSSLQLSQITLYTTLALGVMLFIQLPILKNYFDKRLQL